MTAPSPFLALPRGIRDAIYEHYVAIPGGYVCDPGRFAANVLERNAASVPKINITGLLKGANDQPINLEPLLYLPPDRNGNVWSGTAGQCHHLHHHLL